MSRFRATELLIGDDTDRQAAEAAVVPTITGALSGDQLHFYLELFADGPAAFDGTAATLEVSPEGSSTVVESAPAVLQRPGSDERCRALTGAVAVALLPRGRYVARVVVNVDGRKVGQMTRPFQLVKP
jgi:hypothetical protein